MFVSDLHRSESEYRADPTVEGGVIAVG